MGARRWRRGLGGGGARLTCWRCLLPGRYEQSDAAHLGTELDVLYPLASQNIVIDLDDGVKVKYPKFGAALKKIAGLEASDD